MPIYGIDLGTTYSAIAMLGANNLPEVIENFADGSSKIASVVYFPKDGYPIVGGQAKDRAEHEPERVAEYVMSYIERSDSIICSFDGVDYDAVKILSLILKRIKLYAAEQDHEVKDVIVTCPVNFGLEGKIAIKQASELAGLNVLRFIPKPVAAALSYCGNELNESRQILVFDLGVGTFDLTLIDFSVDENRKSTIKIIASNEDDRLGGIVWDAVLNIYMLDVYADESGVQVNDIPHEIKQRIRAEVEEVKKGLSFMPNKSVSIAVAGESARITLKRDEFERRSKHLVIKTTRLVNEVLETAGVKAEEVDLVLLVGGSTLMPMIRSAVEALFPGRIRVEHPDLAVVKGAALSALELGQDTKREEQKMELAIDQETDQEKIDQEKIDQGIDQKIDQEIDQILDQEIDQKTDQTETSKPAVYGISLGGAYSAIATLGANNLPEVIENYADGSGTLASAVYFTEDGEFVVGKVAKNQAEIEPERVIQYVKQEIGKKDPRIYTFNGIDYDPIRISALILKRIKEYAEEQGHEVKDVVITCPAYFGNEEREATKQAGIIAGFNVLNIVNEPTAAALYYCSHELNESRKILVFDLGGGMFDLTLIDFSVDENGKSMIEIIASNGDDRLGGVDWDAVLNDYMLEVYAGESEVQVNDIPHEIKQRIWAEAEDVKKGLSFTSIRGVSITAAGESARIILTRDEFERRTKHLVTITTRLVNVVLETAGVKAEEVDLVLLVGGSTLMPMIRSAVEALFPGRIRVEQPDLVVAKGAALSAAVEWRDREEKNVVMAKSEYIYC